MKEAFFWCGVLLSLAIVAIIGAVHGPGAATWAWLGMVGVGCLALSFILVGIVIANGRREK